MTSPTPSTGTRPGGSPVRILAIGVVVTLTVALAFEVLLRFVLTYHLDYYTLHRSPGRYELPYGTVLVNSLGFPDAEFDLEDPRPRVGYIGDSVVWGTGAGYGHRIPDLLEASRPGQQHLTLAWAADGIQDAESLVGLVDRLDLDTVVYLMNLNDVLPDQTAPGAPRASWLQVASRFVRTHLDGLRDVSYLYNYSRARLRNALRRHGYIASGRRGIEFFPSEADAALTDTAARVTRAARALGERGVRLCVLLMPYEMQVSSEAAERYQELGIEWEDGFLDRGTQRVLTERLGADVELLDAWFAFVRPDHVQSDRDANALGEFFVFDRGDKIDYNHPTRAGHLRIAEFALARGFCAPGAVAAGPASSAKAASSANAASTANAARTGSR